MIPTCLLMVVKVIIPVCTCLLSLKIHKSTTNAECNYCNSSPKNVSPTSHDNNLNEIAFFELVGNEYDFPLDI